MMKKATTTRNQKVFGVKKPKQARSKETFSNIIEAAARILEGPGIEGLNTNAISEKAGISIGSLYQYFPNKDSIIDHIIREFIRYHFLTLDKKLQELENQNLDATIKEMLQTFVGIFSKRKKLRMVLMHNLPLKALPQIFAAEDEVIAIIKKNLEKHRSEITAKDLDIASYIVVQTVAGSMRGTLAKNRQLNPEDLVGDLFIVIRNYLTK